MGRFIRTLRLLLDTDSSYILSEVTSIFSLAPFKTKFKYYYIAL